MPFRFNQADTAPMRPGYSGVASSLFQGLGGMLGTVKEEMTAEQRAEAERIKREDQVKRDALDHALKQSEIDKNLSWQDLQKMEMSQKASEFDAKNAEATRKLGETEAQRSLLAHANQKFSEYTGGEANIPVDQAVTKVVSEFGLGGTKEGDLLAETMLRGYKIKTDADIRNSATQASVKRATIYANRPASGSSTPSKALPPITNDAQAEIYLKEAERYRKNAESKGTDIQGKDKYPAGASREIAAAIAYEDALSQYHAKSGHPTIPQH